MPARRRSLTHFATSVSIAILALAAALPGAGAAAPQPSGPVRSARVVAASPSVPASGTMEFAVVSEVETGSPYVEVRVQVFRPTGKVLLQRTRVFNDIASSTVVARFDRPAEGEALKEGRYAVEVRVRARGPNGKVNEVDASDRLLVYDPTAPRTPLAVIVRVGGAPGLDPQGRFVEDPATYRAALDAAGDLVALSAARPKLRLTGAVAPVLIEQWARAARGYEIAGAAGVEPVPATDASALHHKAGLESLSRALSTGGLEFLGVPYADPDVPALALIGAEADLAAHLARGRSVVRSALVATPVAGTLPAGGLLPPEGVGSLAAQDVRFAVLTRHSFARPRIPASGTWRISDTTLTALVADPSLGLFAGSPESTPGAAIDRLFEMRSGAPTAPVAAIVDLGPGLPGDIVALERFLSSAESAGWVRLVSASEAASLPTHGTLALAPAAEAPSKAPAGYWDEVAEARRVAIGLAAAAGAQDPDAESALWSLMIAESARWSGADGSWGIADRGRAFAASTRRSADDLLSKIQLNVQDITLSSNSGNVPIVVANGTGKPLALRLVAVSDSLLVENAGTELAVKPSENYATIPVDLRGAISAEMTVSLLAGDLEVAARHVTVRASVLDRLVVIGAVVLVLGIMLFVVYRKVSAVEGGGSAPGDDRIAEGTPTAVERRRRTGKR